MHLEKIVNRKKISLEFSRRSKPLEKLQEEAAGCSSLPIDFKAALGEKTGRPAVIAEIKRASPSKGMIYDEQDPGFRGRLYEEGGAAAVSVLTEEYYFRGSLEDLREVKDSVSIPVLRKDFIIDSYQIYESRLVGADAVLLIVSILEEKELKEFIETAKNLNLSSLVEVHTREELKIALDCGADVVGINNRDLKTFKTDIGVTMELSKEVPDNVMLVSESGIKSPQDIERLEQCGVTAVLIGEALMAHPTPGEKVRELLGYLEDTNGKN
ncbi:indole-3-glycerol phosphate synthase TrpC [Candidatus Contubernalis alkaliaceticus]|uniref:indole-3-glycerol phosphate synthase TrpC n=1 Tax=Candidatus Contubernalis alkaliaceticus TaxID=338645 RepID=UPI001F4C0638|nr:indole-3-glycerol phosphate synthase TrpC [Candidatus Contubernalis alkalaceticus]UNC92607.1 indole-3-glycerol phosphate synthase TrpC [Candidatus Contubernalis alkalaceticus]